MSPEVSRRYLIESLVGVGCALGAPVSVEDKQKLPVVPKRLERAFKAPGKRPNGLQAVPDGLWILDQDDPNKVSKVRYEDGSVLVTLETESLHGSGITFGNGALWIASTHDSGTLKVDPATGKTLAAFRSPAAAKSGDHGLEWVDGKYWIASPPSMTIYLVDPKTGKVVRSIPAPGKRPHGLAWVDGFLWCVESNDRAIYKMDPKDGTLLARIQLTREDPEPHGMTAWKGVFWYSDATSGWICRLV